MGARQPLGQVSAQIDIYTHPGTGEHRITVKGMLSECSFTFRRKIEAAVNLKTGGFDKVTLLTQNLHTLLMITAESELLKRPVFRFTVAVIFPLSLSCFRAIFIVFRSFNFIFTFFCRLAKLFNNYLLQ